MIESSSLKQSLLHANESSSKAPATAAAVVDSSCKRSLTAASAAAGNDEGLTTILSYANIEKQLRRRTVIVGYVIFLNVACKGILFPILWSLCYHLGGNRFDQGW
jgi:hypothetical protein